MKKNEYDYDQMLYKLHHLQALYKVGFRYIARNESGELRAYTDKPRKELNFWFNGKHGISHVQTLDPDWFEELTWQDDKPVKLKSVIDEIKEMLKPKGN